MAIKKEVELELNAKQALKTLDELGGSFEDVYGEVQPLSGRIGELEDRLYEMALAGEQNTAEFKRMTKEVGSMKKVILDTDLVVDGMSQTMAQNLGGSISGVTSAFTLAQGSMAAFGVESEQIEETLLRVQSALAISEGFEGIRQAVPSFKALGNSVKQFGANAISAFKGATTASKAFMVTGIGVLLGAIGLLVANWEKLTDAIGATTAEQKLHNDVQKTAISNISAELSASDKLSRVLKDEKISREDKVQAVKDLQAEYPSLLANVDAENMSISDINKALELNTKLLRLNAEAKAISELRSETYKKKIDAEISAKTNENNSVLAKTIALFGDESTARKVRNAEAANTAKETNKELKVLDDLDAKIQKQISALEDLGATNTATTPTIKAVNTGLSKQEKAAQAAAKAQEDLNKALQDAEAEKQSVLDEIAQAEYEATTTQVEREIHAIQDKYFRLIQLARQYEEDTTILEKEQTKQIQTIRDAANAEEKQKKVAALKEINDAQIALKQEQIKEELEAENEKQELLRKAVQGGFEFLGNLASVFAQGNERQQKIAFKITKVANIAQATMDTYKAAQSAFASFSGIPVVGVPLGIAAAAAAVAAGIANINAIKNTQFQGGGGGAVSAASTSSPSASGGFPAQFNVVGNTGANQLAQSLGNQPLKAYVVAGDVTTAQSLERNKIEQGTL
jgi:hypothetical protein